MKLCESLFVRLIILMLILYFGGLIWFFYSHSSTWSQLWHLCHESSKEFISNEYLLFLSNMNENENENANNNELPCDDESDFLTCEMERQKNSQKKTLSNRLHCINSIRDENYQKIYKINDLIIEQNQHNTLNELFYDIQNINTNDMSLTMELNLNEIKTEFLLEYNNCESKIKKYLTSFSPILGFHVMCFYNFIEFGQSLIIIYQHGYSLHSLPSIPYKNRKKCQPRNFKNGTYYITNECEIEYTLSAQPNPKYLLVSFNNHQNHQNNITSLRKHLQNHLINDIGSYDEYTIEGYDIFNIYNNTNNNEPTQSPETEKLYDKLELKKRNYKSNSHSNNQNIMHLINLIWKKNGNIIFYIFACAYEIIDFCVCSFFLPFVIIRVY